MREVYKPSRDYRFEYLWDAMSFIEEHQCTGCVFGGIDHPDPDYPMCWNISNKMMEEKPMEEIDDLGDQGIRCNIYKEKRDN